MSATVLHTTAVVGDRETLAGLRAGMSGRVHSTFRSVINVDTGQPELLSLTSASVARGPRSIMLGLDRMDHYGVTCGDDVSSDGHTLRVGDSLVVVVAATPSWEDTVISGDPVPERVNRLDSLLAQRQPLARTSPFEIAVAERVQRAISSLSEALLGRDEDAAHRAASSLAGLGVGLTPTGDDVLTGAAFAASRIGEPLAVVWRAVARVVADEATNGISLTAMRCALRGRAAQPVEDLYAWICGGPGNDLEHLVTEVHAIGHTSGADLVLGLLTAVRLHLESQEN